MSELIKPFSFTMNQFDLEISLKAISTLCEEATFKIDQDGLYFKGMDPSHVALIDIAIPNNNFEKFDCNNEQSFGVRLDEMVKTLKQFDKQDRITVNLSEDQTIKLSSNETTYTIRSIEASSTDQPLPKIPYDSIFSLYTKTLKGYCKKIEAVSDYITLQSDNRNLVLSGKGDQGEIKIKLERGMEQLIKLESKQDSLSTYSLEYLIPYLQQFPVNILHTWEYSSAKPLRIDSKVFNVGRMHYYLAPRVEN